MGLVHKGLVAEKLSVGSSRFALMFDEPLPCDEPVESGCTDESAVEAGAALEAVETAQAAGALTESDAAATLAAAAGIPAGAEPGGCSAVGDSGALG